MKVDFNTSKILQNNTKLMSAVATASIAGKVLAEKRASKNFETFDNSKNLFEASQKISAVTNKKELSDSKLYVLSGSSGVGKDTVLRAFLSKHPDFKLSVSYTTRPIRAGEKDGIDYYFLSEEEFEKGIEKGEFLEWGVFSGNKYGTKKNNIEKSLSDKKNIILKLDTIGALKVKRMIPNAILVFIAPPSLEELEFRLRGRKTESEDAIQKRLGAIKTEIENSKQFDYKIINDKVENAVKQLEQVMGLKDV